MHLRAAKFYDADEPDALLAAVHFEAAGDPQHAARLAIDNLEKLINQGQPRALEQLFERLAEQSLESTLQLIVYEAHGDLHYLLGELDDAVRRFEQASVMAARAEPMTQARLQRKLGDVLFRQGQNEAALKSLSLGRTLLTGVTDGEAEAARLAVVDGTVLLALGRYDEAITEAEDALNKLHRSPASEPRVEANVRDLLGKGQFFKGNFTESLTQFHAALELRQSTSDFQGTLKSYSNLAVVYGQQKRYAEALRANQAALEIAERIGDVVAQGHLYNNLAADFANQGKYDQAVEYHNRSLNLHQTMGNLQELARAHHNLGDVYYRVAQFEPAKEHLTEAIELARQTGNESLLEGGTLALAEIDFAQGHAERALTRGLELLAQMARSGNREWQPLALQLLGQVYQALSRWEDARICFAQAKQFWQQREAWIDLATTLLHWAKLEAAAEQVTMAQQLCREAATLAAEYHVAEVLKEAVDFQAQLGPMSVAKGEAA
jgi:tetratricopeptide (TPR) repeat protein